MLNGMTGQAFVPAVLAVSILMRGAALLVLAGAVAMLLRRAPAALHYHVWALAMLGLLALPALSAVLPEWRVRAPDALSAVIAPGISTSAGLADVAADPQGSRRAASAAGSVAGAKIDSAEPSAAVTADAPAAEWWSARAGTLPLGTIVGMGWLIGVVFFAGRLGLAVWRARRLVRRGRAVTDRQWTILVSLLSLKAGLRRDVRIVVSDEVHVPMAWGLLGSWLILPRGIEDWPEDRRRVVVLHELAHLRRHDCIAHTLSELAIAIHWPNPLAWIAARRMRSHRERACDDAVIAAGTGGAAYAHHLVEVARGLNRGARPLRAAVAMARSSELEGRVLAILDDRRNRHGVGRRAALAGAALLGFMVVPLAALGPAPVNPDPGVIPTASESPSESESGPEPRLLDDETSMSDGVSTEAVVGHGTEPLEMAGDAARQVRDATPVGDTIDERVFDALTKALTSDDASLRRRAAHTLGSIESSRGVEALSRAVRSDADAGVRKEAAWGLGMIEDAAAVPALAAAVRDENVDVRRQAAWALGMIESPDAVGALAPLLRDSEADLRKQAAWALGMIESATAVGELVAAFAREEEAEVRTQIVWALGMIEDRGGLDTVVDAVEDPDAEVRDQAMWALGMILN